MHGTFDRMNVRKFAYGIRTMFLSRREARRKWLTRRKTLTQNRMRFSIQRWRGKRSTDNINRTKVADNQNLCYITRYNVTALRLKIANYNLPIARAAKNLRSNTNQNLDFDY